MTVRAGRGDDRHDSDDHQHGAGQPAPPNCLTAQASHDDSFPLYNVLPIPDDHPTAPAGEATKVAPGCGCSIEWPSKCLTSPRALTTKFRPSPSPSANEQELLDIHLPSLSSSVCSILAGPTSHAESGFGSM